MQIARSNNRESYAYEYRWAIRSKVNRSLRNEDHKLRIRTDCSRNLQLYRPVHSEHREVAVASRRSDIMVKGQRVKGPK